MEIREAVNLDDAKYIAEIYRGEIDAEAERVFKDVSKELEELGGNRVVFIAFDADRPIGTVQLVLKRADNDPSLANGVTIAHIHHLRVVKDLQKTGLGRNIMDHAENYARQHGFQRLTLGVDDLNTNAIGFYEHLGYKIFKKTEGKTPTEKLF